MIQASPQIHMNCITLDCVINVPPHSTLDAKCGIWCENDNRVHPRFIHQRLIFFSHCWLHCSVLQHTTPVAQVASLSARFIANPQLSCAEVERKNSRPILWHLNMAMQSHQFQNHRHIFSLKLCSTAILPFKYQMNLATNHGSFANSSHITLGPSGDKESNIAFTLSKTAETDRRC